MRDGLPLCDADNVAHGAWQPLKVPTRGACAHVNENIVKWGCQAGQCLHFHEGYEWRPADCTLAALDAPAFCRALGKRVILFVGDSTMDQTHGAIANEMRAAGCTDRLIYRSADTLVAKPFGAWNRGLAWPKVLANNPADILILGVGPHVYGEDNYSSIIHTVADQYARLQPRVPMIWKSIQSGGCGPRPLSVLPDAENFWDSYGASSSSDANSSFWNGTSRLRTPSVPIDAAVRTQRQRIWNWPSFQSRDEFATNFWRSRGVPVLNVAPLYYRVDAHPSSDGGAQNAFSATKREDLYFDCLHMCPQVLGRLLPQLLLTLLLTDKNLSQGQPSVRPHAKGQPRESGLCKRHPGACATRSRTSHRN